MKVKYDVVQKRRNDLLMIIQKYGDVEVKQLMNEFNVSEVTIRRDLQYWQDKGAIIRYHGGAKLVQQMLSKSEIKAEYTNNRYKHAIAKFAAQYVEDGDTIFINTSSTALLVIQYIKDKRCTIITNNAKALMCPHDDKVSIVLTGGELRFPKEAMVGDFALNNLSRVFANKCFLGCSGINVEAGVSTAILSETAINETMVKRTNGPVFVLADYSKVGISHSFESANLNDIDYLITDINADEEMLAQIKEFNVEIHRLEPLLSVPDYNFIESTIEDN